MTTRNSLLVAVVIGGILAGPSELRADSNLQKKWPSANGDLETVGQPSVVRGANQTLTFKVRELENPNSYPNVILDVFSYPGEQLLGEGRWSSSGGNAEVSLPAPTSNGIVTVIVRSTYDTANPPPAQLGVPLAVTRNNGVSWGLVGQYDIAPKPRIFPSGGLKSGTVVSTVEEPEGEGGASDTVLLVLEDDNAIAFDDDMGIQRMSRLTLATTCGYAGHTCSILAARRSNYPEDKSNCLANGGAYDFPARSGTTTVVWDEDISNGVDADGDGLGDALEVALGTSSSTADVDGDGVADGADTDGDGIRDGWEVLGIFDFNNQQTKDFCKKNLLNFPYYGADPLQQDIFAEVAWLSSCVDPAPTVCAPGHPSDPSIQDKDAYQWSANVALDFMQSYAPDFRTHVDIGPWDGVPDTYNYGNWGGAVRLPDTITVDNLDTDPVYNQCGFSAQQQNDYQITSLGYCQGFGQPVQDTTAMKCLGTDSPRYGYFAHMVDDGPSSWGGMCAGLCSKTGAEGHVAAHETGHHFGLGHGGYEGLYCKPNYLSIMSYCIGYWDLAGGGNATLPAFSHGWFLSSASGGEGLQDVILNPAKLDEGAGLGKTFPRNFDVPGLEKSKFRTLVDTDKNSPTYGGIDWNDDGKIESPGTLVAGYLDRGYPRPLEGWNAATTLPTSDAQAFPGYDAIAPYPTSSNQFGFGLRYASWDSSTLQTQLGFLTPSACSSGDNCQVFTSSAGSQTSKRVKSMIVVDDLLIFQADDGSLNTLGNLSNGLPASATLRSAYSGPPAGVTGVQGSYSNGDSVMKIYAGSHVSGQPGLSQLYAQDIDMTTGQLLNGGWWIPQYWDNGDLIYIPDDTAIGVTRGYIKDATGVATEAVVAAIPDWTGVNGKHIVEFAILKQTAYPGDIVLDAWERPALGTMQNIDVRALEVGHGRVGLSYRPDDPSDLTVGRYYMTWQNPQTDSKGVVTNPLLLGITQGNVLPADSSACSIPRGLCFPSFGFVADGGTDWPAGVLPFYAGGHVRAVAGPGGTQSSPEYFPHMDGIIDQDQKDCNDYHHIKTKMKCALTFCPTIKQFD